MTSCENGAPRGVGCNLSPSGSNAKNKNNSPILIPILFHEVIIHKCICHGFYFIHCIQFSQLNDLYIVRSCAKSEVREVDGRLLGGNFFAVSFTQPVFSLGG